MRSEATTVYEPQATLIGALWPEQRSSGSRLVRLVILALLGTVLLALAAKVKVPFYPVPTTLQTLALAVLAATYGSRLAVATVLLYLAEGMLGLPVFTNTPPAAAGPLYLLGPTGGYLIGFVLAAAIIGTLAEQGADKSIVRLFGAMLLGSAAVLLCGVVWLAWLAQLPSGSGIGLAKAVSAGLVPFLLGDLVKSALAATLVRAGWTFASRRR